jgi:WD40 repeat protein
MNVELSLKAELHDHQNAVREIAVHPSGKWFFARSDDMLILYDLKTYAKLRGFYDSAGYQSAAWDADGKMLLYMSEDRVHFFDLGVFQDRMLLDGELSEFRDTDAHIGAGLIAMPGDEGTIKINQIGADEDAPPLFTLGGHTNYIEYLVFHPSGKILASGSADTTIRIWDLENKKEIAQERAHTDFVTGLAFSPDGSILISGDYAGRLKIWNFKVS